MPGVQQMSLFQKNAADLTPDVPATDPSLGPHLKNRAGGPWAASDAPKMASARYALHRGDALDAYRRWPTPACIISDGAYGVRGFPGDTATPEELPDWYAPHVAAWSKAATPASVLWFWNTEIGWASTHPLLVANGWKYEFAITWDKTIKHVAGNWNGQTARRWPVVTEICVMYSRPLVVPTLDGEMPVKDWMRHEWKRAGLRYNEANAACGVINAASRKYMATEPWLWYPPSPEIMEKLVAYANEHGVPAGRPYYSLDGVLPVTAAEWGRTRYTWNNGWHGVTNVWSLGPLNGKERHRGTGEKAAPRQYAPTTSASLHLNQKPLEAMRRLVQATTNKGDVVWEPFGGLCSGSVAAVEEGRFAYAAEPVERFEQMARDRLRAASKVAAGRGSGSAGSSLATPVPAAPTSQEPTR